MGGGMPGVIPQNAYLGSLRRRHFYATATRSFGLPEPRALWGDRRPLDSEQLLEVVDVQLTIPKNPVQQAGPTVSPECAGTTVLLPSS